MTEINLEQETLLQSSLKNILEQNGLKWIFIVGKGGVGKTTCSCSIAVQLSYVRRNVLLLSIDSAHNLSDAFDQKFYSSPTLVNGFSNLFAMEIDPQIYHHDDSDLDEDDPSKTNSNLWKNILHLVPGIDEALTYATVMKLDKGKNYSVVVFDTAPTGQTLRLLAFPTLFAKILSMSRSLLPVLTHLSLLFGTVQDRSSKKWKEILKAIKYLSIEFTDPALTTFVCVSNANFVSLYENERLIQELLNSNIDTRNIIVNKLHTNQVDNNFCETCSSKSSEESKYLEQFNDLYQEDFHIIKLPMLGAEVRGVNKIIELSKLLGEKKSI